jgi:hypothetical protein
MVTRVPAVRPDPPADVRDLVARCLYDGPGDPLTDGADRRVPNGRSVLLRKQADRLLAALAAAGLELGPGAPVHRPVGAAR